MVCIIDDREEVWRFTPNMVKVKPYHFFARTADINAPRGLERKDDDSDDLKSRKVTVHKVRKKRKTNSEAEKEEESSGECENEQQKTNSEQEKCATESDEKPLSDAQDSEAKKDSPPSNDETEDTKDNNEEDRVSRQESSSLTATKEEEKGEDGDDEWEEVIEWEDSDDYLLYLDDILTNLHSTFFDMHDQQARSQAPATERPNLKKIIPSTKQKVLEGAQLVFSGLVPINMPLARSRPYAIATGLGAQVHTNLVLDGDKRTTHVVATNIGTSKVKEALKHPGTVRQFYKFYWITEILR